MQERKVLKLDITCVQLLYLFLLSLLSSFLFSFHLPFILSLPKLIYMKEGVMRPPYIFKIEYIFKSFT